MFSLIFFALLVVHVFASKGSSKWEDTELTSNLWRICSTYDTNGLIEILSDQSIVPPAAFARSKDGRGPLFWAYEYGFKEGIQVLEEIGVSPLEKDAKGKTPKDLGEENLEINKRRASSQRASGSNAFSEDHYGAEEEDYGDVYDDNDEF